MTYTYDGYKLVMHNTYDHDGEGHFKVKYTLRNPQGKILFSGSDFGSSPMHGPTSKQSACALLSFLTLRPGDTDAEYFADYTQEQLDFANGPAEYIGYFWRMELGDNDL